MEIPFNRKPKPTRKTDLIALNMRNPLAASLTAKLLGTKAMDTRGPTPRERIEDWLSLYRGLPESATLEQLENCWGLCPDTSLQEAQRLQRRFSVARAQAAAPRPPSP